MSKWREVRIGDVAPFKYGKTKTAKARIEGEYTVFSSSGHCGYSNDILADSGIIVGRKGTVGTVFYSDKPFFCIDTAFYIDEVEENSNIIFIYYYLKTLKLEKYNNDAAVPGLNRNLAHGLKIKIPDLETQKKIADVLSTYDELIENNNRRIEILEKTAEEIYKEWFVRMRFPGYENIKFNKGIPEGWEVKRVGDVAKVKSGFAFKSEWWQDKGIPVIKIKDIQNNTVNLTGLFYVSKENADKAKQFYVSAGDLLIAMTGATIGKTALVPYCNLMTVNQRVGKFFLGDNPQNKVAFLFCLFLQSHIQEQIITIGSSNAAQPNISPFDIEKIKIVYNESVINEFNQKVQPCISLILKLQQQNQNLIKQRDLLLPRLMNGTIEIR